MSRSPLPSRADAVHLLAGFNNSLGASRKEHDYLGRIVVLWTFRETHAPAATRAALAPALDAAKDHLLDRTPRVSAAAERSAMRASPPFIASAAAKPIIDVSVM